jgi:hypothetical protein
MTLPRLAQLLCASVLLCSFLSGQTVSSSIVGTVVDPAGRLALALGSTSERVVVTAETSIEYEYDTPEGSDVLTEVKKCVKFCKEALA